MRNSRGRLHDRLRKIDRGLRWVCLANLFVVVGLVVGYVLIEKVDVGWPM